MGEASVALVQCEQWVHAGKTLMRCLGLGLRGVGFCALCFAKFKRSEHSDVRCTTNYESHNTTHMHVMIIFICSIFYVYIHIYYYYHILNVHEHLYTYIYVCARYVYVYLYLTHFIVYIIYE